MNRSGTMAVGCAALALALAPSLAIAGAHPNLKGDKPPAAGRWTMKVGPSPSSKTGGGSFVVTKTHLVKKMHIIVNPQDVSACGAAKFTVKGPQKLHKIYNGNGQDEWAVGKYVAGASPSYKPIKISVTGKGKTYKSTLAMSFNSRSDTDTRTYGYAAVKGTPGGICYLDFTFKKR